MPRARRRCAKPDCKRFQPCQKHPRGWRANDQKIARGEIAPLPGNWKSIVKAVRVRSGGQCEVEDWYGPINTRCKNRAASVDHIISRAEWPPGVPGADGFHPYVHHPSNNVRDTCKPHHDKKTAIERARGNRRSQGG